jgi:hypothetical protein
VLLYAFQRTITRCVSERGNHVHRGNRLTVVELRAIAQGDAPGKVIREAVQLSTICGLGCSLASQANGSS